MPRKKKKIVSLEVLEVNATWDYRGSRYFKNFVCNEEDAESTLKEMDARDVSKTGQEYTKQAKAILAPKGTRISSCCFFGDDVSYEEVKLPASVKAGTKYIYKVYDYSDGKLNTEYGTQKEALAYISKRIKTKNAYVAYNGVGGKIEYSPKAVANIFNTLEPTTSQLEIEPMGRSGTTEDMILVSIFKNCIR